MNLFTLLSPILPSIVQMIGGLFGIDVNSESNRAKAIEAEMKLKEMLAGMPELQTEVNKVEAAHPSIFVAGWRPAVGWICALGVGYGWLLRPLLQDFILMFGGNVILPALQFEQMITLLLGMLGLGGFRMVESIKGTARHSWSLETKPTIPLSKQRGLY